MKDRILAADLGGQLRARRGGVSAKPGEQSSHRGQAAAFLMRGYVTFSYGHMAIPPSITLTLLNPAALRIKPAS